MSKVVKGVALAAGVILTGGALVFAAPGIFATMAFYTGVTTLATAAFLSGVSAQLASRKAPRYTVDVEYAGTVEPRRILYGFNRVSGMHTIPPLTTGTNNKFLHKVLTLAGHQVNAISAVYFNQEAVGTIGSITGASTDGAVSSGTFSGKAWVRRYLGTSTQTADYILDNALSVWTSDHRGRGVAYVAIQKELSDTVWKQGETTDTFDVEGKLCYDPRLDTSPGANPTSATYKAYRRNPTLQRVDYLIDDTLGLGEDPARIDWDMVVAAADIDDELVDVPTAATQERYRGDLALFATDPYEDNILSLSAMNLGSTLYSGGKWRVRTGAWETASFEITDSNVMGALELETAYPYKERWNSIRGSFRDPASNYQPNEFPPISVASYVSADGETVYKDVTFDCINVYEAQRKGILLARKSRNAEVATIPCDLSLWKVRPGDTGIATITELGWTNQQIRCESWSFTPDGLVALRVRKEAASDWDDPLETDYLTPTAVSTPSPSYFTPDAPSGLTATGTAYGITFNWTAPALVPAGSEYELYEYTSSTPFASSSLVWKGRGTTATIGKTDLTTRYYWVRLVMPDGTAGTEYPTSTSGVAGACGTVTEMQRTTISATSITGTLSSQQTLGSVTAPSRPIAYTFVVSAIFGANVTADTFGGGAIYVYIRDSTRGTFATSEAVVYAAALSSTAGNNVMIEDSFSIPANTSVTYNLYAFQAASTAAAVSDIVLKAEAIKL